MPASETIAGKREKSYLEPFDPKKHKPRDVGYGGPSTEITITEYDPDGKVWNIPSLWWDSKGEPVVVDQQDAVDLAVEYEKRTGKKFPRYKTIEEGDKAAEERSRKGGAMNGMLAR